jgi:chemotaxis protein MotB
MPMISRRRSDEAEDSSAFWLITYSDMVTLLLAFFLLLYSFSVLSEDRQHELVEELRSVSANPVVRERAAHELETAAREIASQFEGDHAFVENTESEVTIGLSSAVTFATGDDALSAPGRDALVKAAAILAKLPNTVRVEGHTDDVPVRSGRFSSNWHLSAARAQCVVRLLVAEGVDPGRLQVVGFGDVRPRVPGATPETRAANRRIEIKILRQGGAAPEPPAP